MAWIDGKKIKLCKFCNKAGHTQFDCPKRKISKRNNTQKLNKKPIPRHHQRTRETLEYNRNRIINLLDKEFSRYFRMLQMSSSGYCRCFICDKKLSYEQACIGHYKSRRFISTRFNPINANVICYKCNEINSNQPEILKLYKKKIIEKYGESAIKQIQEDSQTKMSTEELRELLDFYRKNNRIIKK